MYLSLTFIVTLASIPDPFHYLFVDFIIHLFILLVPIGEIRLLPEAYFYPIGKEGNIIILLTEINNFAEISHSKVFL